MSEKHYHQIRHARANDIPATVSRTFSYMAAYGVKSWLIIIGIVISAASSVASAYFFTPIINNYLVPYIGASDVDLSGFIRDRKSTRLNSSH